LTRSHQCPATKSSGIASREDFGGWKTYVLVVEDNTALRDIYRSAVRAAGHVVVGVADGVKALRLIASQAPSVIVLDLALTHLDAHAVLHSR
jgi:CheY-like chemotaxis protein